MHTNLHRRAITNLREFYMWMSCIYSLLGWRKLRTMCIKLEWNSKKMHHLPRRPALGPTSSELREVPWGIRLRHRQPEVRRATAHLPRRSNLQPRHSSLRVPGFQPPLEWRPLHQLLARLPLGQRCFGVRPVRWGSVLEQQQPGLRQLPRRNLLRPDQQLLHRRDQGLLSRHVLQQRAGTLRVPSLCALLDRQRLRSLRRQSALEFNFEAMCRMCWQPVVGCYWRSVP